MVPTVVNVPVAVLSPPRTSVMVLLSLASTSRSLASTLPVGFRPGVPLAVPPASTATVLSSAASGLSLAPRMMMVSVDVLLAPKRSRT
ncbi:hypothetical protein D3C75_1063050 [compost metagenome]